MRLLNKVVLSLGIFGQLHSTVFCQGSLSTAKFEVASVKRNAAHQGYTPDVMTSHGVRFTNIALTALLIKAFDVKPFQISAPSWFENEYYDVDAKAPPGSSRDQVIEMLKQLIIERFRMIYRIETRDFPVYHLVVAQTGARLNRVDLSKDPGAVGTVRFSGSGHLKAQTLDDFANLLTFSLGRLVVNATGLTGTYEIDISVSPEELPGLSHMRRQPRDSSSPTMVPGLGPSKSDVVPDNSLSSALKDLGLRLESRKTPLRCIIVEYAQKVPIPN
jgi:uncharacterized protein (TIGR03435 family)